MNQNTQSIFTPIFSYVRTTPDAAELLSHIDILLAEYYTVQNDPFEKRAYAVLDPQIAQVIQTVFRERNMSWSHFEEVKAFLTGLKDAVQACAVLTLTLSYTPTNEAIAVYTEWARKNLTPEILLEIHTDETIIGGAVIVFKGHYIDQSIKKQLNSYFTKQRETILSKIRTHRKEQ